MKKKKTIALIGLSLFFLIDIVSSNPLPLTNYGSGTPFYVSTNTSICFLSENVTYEINDGHWAEVTAVYVFHNPTNTTIEQTLAIPFDIGLPRYLQIFANTKEIFNASFSNNQAHNIEFNGETYSAYLFAFDFKENQTTHMTVRYDEYYSVPLGILEFENPFFGSKTCTYLAKTGASWNNTLNATFTFKINQNMFPIGLDGYNKTYEGGYVVASKSFAHWIPDEDITIEWTSFNIPCCLGVILPIILVTIIIILWRNKRKKSIPKEKV